MTKKSVELIILGALLVLSVLLYSSTAAYPQAVQGSTAAYVRFLAGAMGLLCLLEGVFCLRRKNTSPESSAESSAGEHKDAQAATFSVGAHPKTFWILFLLLMAYGGIFPYLGFYVSSALFLPITMLALGARKPVTISLTTLGVLAFVYLVFESVLEVYMPVGTFFE